MAVQVLPEVGKFALGEESQDAGKSSGALSHVLIVDDENGPRQALRMLLKEDYVVHLAPNVAQALDVLEEEPIGLVITDLRMPKQRRVHPLRQT